MVFNRSHLTLLMVFNRLHITLLMVFDRLHITLLMVFNRSHFTFLVVFNRTHFTFIDGVIRVYRLHCTVHHYYETYETPSLSAVYPVKHNTVQCDIRQKHMEITVYHILSMHTHLPYETVGNWAGKIITFNLYEHKALQICYCSTNLPAIYAAAVAMYEYTLTRCTVYCLYLLLRPR